MTFDEGRARFAVYLGAEEVTLDPIISTTDRDALINEAYIEMEASYGGLIRKTEWNNGVGSFINIPTPGAQVSMIMGMEAAVAGSGLFVPMTRSQFLAVMKRHLTEGAVAVLPEVFGVALRSQDADATPGTSYAMCVYPALVAPGVDFRMWWRDYKLELVNGTDVFQLDDPLVDYVVRIAAYRAGYTLGYDDAFLSELVAPIEDGIRMAIAIDHYNRFTGPPGLVAKPGEDREAKVGV